MGLLNHLLKATEKFGGDGGGMVALADTQSRLAQASAPFGMGGQLDHLRGQKRCCIGIAMVEHQTVQARSDEITKTSEVTHDRYGTACHGLQWRQSEGFALLSQ